MTWIDTCEAPSLDHLKAPVLGLYFLSLELAGKGGHDDPQVRSYVQAFIVSTDKALRCYNAGRDNLIAYAASANRTMLLFDGLGHFETCVSTAKRCLSLADRMARHKQNPEIDQIQRRRLDSYQRQIEPLRNAIEHIDRDIAKGLVQPGDLQMLAVTRDGRCLAIGKHQLRFIDLAATLEMLHGLAEALASRNRTL
jgi:hypothetical protein